MSKYSIVIKRVDREQVTERKYVVIGKKKNGEDDYGYAEEGNTQDISREIYTQFVDELNLVEVIKAINGLGEQS